MTRGVHAVEQHRSALPGVEAMTLLTAHVFPRHAHDGFGLGLITRGAQRSWSGIGPIEAEAGDVITVNPGEVHDGAPLGDGPRDWRTLYLGPREVGREGLEWREGQPEIPRPALRDPVLAALLSHFFAEVTREAPDGFGAEEALLRTVARLLGRHGARRRGAGGASPSVAAARRRMDAAPELPVSLAELAALSGVSRFQLLRGFHREVGITPHAYLVAARVRLARRLLAAGRRPAEVAASAGFADQSHLTRAFLRQFGVTPARYRAAVA